MTIYDNAIRPSLKIQKTNILCVVCFTFCIFASVVTLFNKDSKCVFHRADMAVGSLAPITFVALGIPFLYVLDTFFQKLTESLACKDLAMTSARAISSRY